MKIFIREINGDHNYEASVKIDDGSNGLTELGNFVEFIRNDGGYIVPENDGYGFCFVPFHRIEFIQARIIR